MYIFEHCIGACWWFTHCNSHRSAMCGDCLFLRNFQLVHWDHNYKNPQLLKIQKLAKNQTQKVDVLCCVILSSLVTNWCSLILFQSILLSQDTNFLALIFIFLQRTLDFSFFCNGPWIFQSYFFTSRTSNVIKICK